MRVNLNTYQNFFMISSIKNIRDAILCHVDVTVIIEVSRKYGKCDSMTPKADS